MASDNREAHTDRRATGLPLSGQRTATSRRRRGGRSADDPDDGISHVRAALQQWHNARSVSSPFVEDLSWLDDLEDPPAAEPAPWPPGSRADVPAKPARPAARLPARPATAARAYTPRPRPRPAAVTRSPSFENLSWLDDLEELPVYDLSLDRPFLDAWPVPPYARTRGSYISPTWRGKAQVASRPRQGWPARVWFIALAVLSAANAPLFVPNLSAAQLTVPSNEIAAVALLSSLRETKKKGDQPTANGDSRSRTSRL